MDLQWNPIEEAAKANNGFIQTAQVVELGISRLMLKKCTNAGDLERVRKGLYVLNDNPADEYALLQVRSTFAVFSYGTALYLWDLSNRTHHVYDIILPRSANKTR